MTTLAAFEEAVRLIEENPDLADFGPGVSDEDIAQAARLIGFPFPPSYCAFLKRFGVGDFKGSEFFGLIAGKIPGSGIPCAVWTTLEQRRDDPGFPRDHLIVGVTGYGPHITLNLHTDPGRESEVMLRGFDGMTDVIAPDFGSFFRDQIARSLE